MERPEGAPCAARSSLSYVILQLEAPRLLETHFDAAGAASDETSGGGADAPRLTSIDVVAQAAARLDALALA